MAGAHTETEVLIVGAGFSGLGASMMLDAEGISDHVVIERADTLGGTWRDNGYPGCACDIPSVLYSYELEQNPDWTRAFAPQPEILEYLRAVARRHGLDRRVRYRHELLSADYDERRQRWDVQTSGGSFTARVLISAVGALADPSIPALEGLQRSPAPCFTPPAGTTTTISPAAGSRSSAPARRRSSSFRRSSTASSA